MKLAVALASLLLTACSSVDSKFDLAQADQLIDYPIQNDQYAIVVLEERGVSSSQARKMALQRAAELTVESGNRYYTIESEEKTLVARSDKDWPDNNQGNLYQEVIIRENFDKTALDRQMPNTGETTVPALRIIIKCYGEKPSKRSYDACQSTQCP